ncbi:097L [Cherax quadricarinatus iridovirus]|nr:097L [Cherax quadricarinatus iridovirus]UPA43410.1 097L [Iridovirus CN01]ASZ85077.1 097L [Cherax quadricarinatus iridovirus]UPA43486.1 097L [Iridovirus CN01]UPA43682.1 097L [Iridovirus CN01]UPA43844.1 097L [Iridovirus CN01]
MDFNYSQINNIQFGILSDEQILKKSVANIFKTTLSPEDGSVYDPKLGSVENDVKCETCNEDMWTCTGHFGHINLNVPIILFHKQASLMLKIFCFNCHRMLCTKEDLNLQGIKGYSKIINHISTKVSFCRHCNNSQPSIKFDSKENNISAFYKQKNVTETLNLNPEYIKMIFDNIPNEDVAILGVNPDFFHPKHLVLTKFPVIPTCCRPKMTTPDNISDDDLSIILIEIIKINNLLAKDTENVKNRDILKFKTLTYCNNSKNKAVHNTNHKPMTGIKERITKKTGHMRQNIMGKRCNNTARTVVGPDPTLKLNEVAVPEQIANSITIPEYVTPFSIDKLTKLVNTPGKTTSIVKKDGRKLTVSYAGVKSGTYLNHGDVIERDGKKIEVMDCKMKLKETDIIYRPEKNEKGEFKKEYKIVKTVLPKQNHIELEIGDRVMRYLQNGDFVLLNRQPTLHRNSMQGMKVVIKPGKTVRVNLAIVTGFNMDFDGDEANLFIEETLEARTELEYLSNAVYNILSHQANKPEMVIVQDSLLGAYKMTESIKHMRKDQFMKCLMHIEHDYNFVDRMKQIRAIRNEKDDEYTAHALFGFLFPDNFHISYDNNLEIKYGVVTKGYFDKTTLKGSKRSLIRILCLEYGPYVTAKFIDNIQFMTNGWLEMNPFSIGIQDCLIGNPQKKMDIKNTTQKYFLEANNVAKSTDNIYIRESRINCALNKAKDLGLKIAKEALKPDNNFISTVTSGSKGDYFNIAQITGLLGQQNLDGQRPTPTLSNNKRTLIHYPEVIMNDPARKYRSRGFVASSFIEGMYPDEMFFHAMTGRDGMTKTSMGTASSGYLQRSITKINEDIKVEYDGTVRDAKKNIYQFLYGNHGFDPSKVTINEEKGEVYPVNFERLAGKLNMGSSPEENKIEEAQFLTEEEIEEIVDGCKFHMGDNIVYQQMERKQNETLRKLLNRVKLVPERFPEFKRYTIEKYYTCRATPGDCVGIIGAASIGEKQTQSTLNTFHTAGKLQKSGTEKLEEITCLKKLKMKTCSLYFYEKYKTSDELRKAVGCSIVGLYFRDVYVGNPSIEKTLDKFVLNFELDPKTMYQNRLNSFQIAKAINKNNDSNLFENIKCTIGNTSIQIAFDRNEMIDCSEHISSLENILVCGMENITAMHLCYEDNEWFILTEGSNLEKLLTHPLIDKRRLYCNNIMEVYNCLGISAVRKMLSTELKNIIGGVNSLHIQLLVDKMTQKGKPTAFNRYTMRINDVGPMSKATFEESVDILVTAAMKTEVENNVGVSAAVISGNQPKVGTGCMGLLVDFEKLLKPKTEAMPSIQEDEEDDYVPDDFM